MIPLDTIETLARQIGLDFCSVARAGRAPHADALQEWVQAGYAADMRWFERSLQKRTDPRHVLADAQSVITVGVSYFCEAPPPELWNDPARGHVARYAWGPDYHAVLGHKLQKLAEALQAALGRSFQWRACVDSGPIIERGFAAARRGFIGRNAVYIHPTFGAYVVLGELLVAEAIEETAPLSQPARCPPCSACLESCPTQAFAAPYTLDARRCIAYHTVENRGNIPAGLRAHMRRWLFGCDECLQVCPFTNRLSRAGQAANWRFDPERHCPRLATLLQWRESDFEDCYTGTVIERLGWRRFLRNALVASGNSAFRELIPLVEHHAQSSDEMIRDHAEWALVALKQAPP